MLSSTMLSKEFDSKKTPWSSDALDLAVVVTTGEDWAEVGASFVELFRVVRSMGDILTTRAVFCRELMLGGITGPEENVLVRLISFDSSLSRIAGSPPGAMDGDMGPSK